MWKVREIADKVTNVVMNYTEIEAKVREATNDDAWGSSGTLKHELSQATFSYDQFPEVMGMLWKRIAENKKSPRRIYKSLLLLHHLLLNGSDRVIRATQDRIYELRSLTEYHVIYEPGFSLNSIIPPEVTKDGEMNVRVKAKEIVDLVQDDERLREDRKKAKKNRDKYVGIGSDRMMTSRWGGSMGSDFDDMGEDIGRSRSPQASTPSPVLSKQSITTTTASTTIKKPVFNEKPPVSAFDLIDDSNDFNPRAGESEDYGEFASAQSSTSVSSTTTSSAAAPAPAKQEDFFQADFQGAFGGSSGVNNSVSSGGVGDILGLSNNILDQSNSSLTSSSSTFMQNSLFNVAPPSASSSSLSSTTATTFKQTDNQQIDLLGGLGSIVFDNSLSQMENVIPQQTLHSQLPQTQQNLQFNHHPQQLFEVQSSHNSILQPVIQSNVQSNNINNNSGITSNKQAASLKGTTWSDLNISIDDLTINPSSRNQTVNKPTINQLKSIQNK